MRITFETRAGMKVEGIAIPGGPEHAVTVRIIKARKPFADKTLLFAKSDMLNVKAA